MDESDFLNATTAETLVKAADDSLSRAKKMGRDRNVADCRSSYWVKR
jgi:hypothetical protein